MVMSQEKSLLNFSALCTPSPLCLHIKFPMSKPPCSTFILVCLLAYVQSKIASSEPFRNLTKSKVTVAPNFSSGDGIQDLSEMDRLLAYHCILGPGFRFVKYANLRTCTDSDCFGKF